MISEIWGNTARSVFVLTSYSPHPLDLSVGARAEINGFHVPLAHIISVMLGWVWEAEKLLLFSSSVSLGWEALQPGAKVGRHKNLLSGVWPSWWFPAVGKGQAEPRLSKLWFPNVPSDPNSFLKACR